MRTKTLVLTALIGLASVAASVAQVYSLNAVGYVNKDCPPGFSILANPLDTANNTVASLIPSAPFGTQIWTWDTSAPGFISSVFGYLDDDGNPVNAWTLPTVAMNPGAGFWIKNAATTNFTVTFVGTVLTGNLTNAVVPGYQILGSKVPQTGALDSVLGYVPTYGDQLLFWRSGGYVACNYGYLDDDGNPVNAWTLPPTPEVGEGFWLKAAVAGNWVRTFSIN